MAFKAIQLRIYAIRKSLDLQVGGNARWRYTLRKNNSATLHSPASQQGTRVESNLLGELCHERVVDRAWLSSLVITQGRVCLDNNALALAELEELGLLQVWVGFDLVGSGHDGDLTQEVLQAPDIEIGNTNGLDLSSLKKFLHRFVGLDDIHIGQLERTVLVQWEPLVPCFERAKNQLAKVKK